MQDKSDSISELINLKQQVLKLQRETDKASGALERSMEELKKKFECKSIKEAESLLEDLKEREEKLDQLLQTKLEKFKEEFSNILGD